MQMTDGPNFHNPYIYTGRETAENGLYYYRARYYLPEVGRFGRVDPVGLDGGMNGFKYADCNAINYIDPMGLTTWDCTFGYANAGLISPGGGIYVGKCLSRCECNKKVECVVVLAIAGLTASVVPVDGNIFSATLSGGPSCSSCESLSGLAGMFNVGGGFIAGFSLSKLQIGEVEGDFNLGFYWTTPQIGVDVFVGASYAWWWDEYCCGVK